MSLLLLLSNSSASVPVQATFDPLTLAHQRIVTTGVEKTITVNAPSDSAVEFFVDGVKAGDMVSAGDGVFNYDWTAGSVNYNGVLVKAVGNTSGDSEELLIVIAAANNIDPNISGWGKSGCAVSTGHESWDGTNTAFRVYANADKTNNNVFLSKSYIAPSTVNNHAIEFWIKSDQIDTVYALFGNCAGYINQENKQSTSTFAPVAVVEELNGYSRVWMQQVTRTAPSSTLFVRLCTQVGTQTLTALNNDGLYISDFRVIDGVLPLTQQQKLNAWHETTESGIEKWRLQHEYGGVVGSYPTFWTYVIKPSTWSSAGNYVWCNILLGILSGSETGAGGDIPRVVAYDSGLADSEDMIFVVTEWTTIGLWNGAGEDGDYNQHAFNADIIPFFAKYYLACSSDKNDALVYGYSKSAVGAFNAIMMEPDVYGYAAGVDGSWLAATVDFADPEFDMTPTFLDTQENALLYDAWTLAAGLDGAISDRTRLVLRGYKIFEDEVDAMAARLDAYSIPYSFRNELITDPHRFDMDTEFEDAVEEMLRLRSL